MQCDLRALSSPGRRQRGLAFPPGEGVWGTRRLPPGNIVFSCPVAAFVQPDQRAIHMSQLYGVLGVARAATDEQIKVAFRKLAMTCHPDLCRGDQHAERRFQEILSAYETLCDAKRRARYDEACAEARRRALGRLKRAAATMAVSFVLTVSSGSLIGIWLVKHVFL